MSEEVVARPEDAVATNGHTDPTDDLEPASTTT
jgi:hypothetical protein